MKPATELIHGDGVSHDAEPLTTPIYETTTFVFENAAEVRAYNEGKSAKFLYSRYANPDRARGRTEDRRGSREPNPRWCSRAARQRRRPRSWRCFARGDEVVCSAAIYGGTLHLLADLLAKFGIRPRFVSLEELADARVASSRRRRSWCGSSRRSIRRCGASISPPWRARAGPAQRDLGASTTRLPARSTSSRSPSASIS